LFLRHCSILVSKVRSLQDFQGDSNRAMACHGNLPAASRTEPALPDAARRRGPYCNQLERVIMQKINQ
ncbi:hypothetical protein, partial [Mycobacterium avium]|uniref:hypothetical protein n=1 Tax=Mycobacterium avium TaxID=1764 RepID=UPI001CC3F1FC